MKLLGYAVLSSVVSLAAALHMNTSVGLHRAVSVEALQNLMTFLMKKTELYNLVWLNSYAFVGDQQSNYKNFWWLYTNGDTRLPSSETTLTWCAKMQGESHAPCQLNAEAGTLKMRSHKMTLQFTEIREFSWNPGDILAEFKVLSAKSRDATWTQRAFGTAVMHDIGTGTISLEQKDKLLYWTFTVLNTKVNPPECYKVGFIAHLESDANAYAEGPNAAKLIADGMMSRYNGGCSHTGTAVTFSYGASFEVGINLAMLGVAMTLSINVCVSLAGIKDRLACMLISSSSEGEENPYIAAILSILSNFADNCGPNVCFQFGFSVVPFPPFVWPIPTVSMNFQLAVTDVSSGVDCLHQSIEAAMTDAVDDKVSEAKAAVIDPIKKEAMNRLKAAKNGIIDKVKKFFPKKTTDPEAVVTVVVETEPGASSGGTSTSWATWWKATAWKQLKTLVFSAFNVGVTSYGPIFQLLPIPSIGFKTSTASNVAQALYTKWASYQSPKISSPKDKGDCKTLQTDFKTKYDAWTALASTFWTSGDAAPKCQSLRPDPTGDPVLKKKLADYVGKEMEHLQTLFKSKPLDLVPLLDVLKRKERAAKSGWVISLPCISWTSSSMTIGISDDMIRKEDPKVDQIESECAPWKDFVNGFHNDLGPALYAINGAEDCPLPETKNAEEQGIQTAVAAATVPQPVCPADAVGLVSPPRLFIDKNAEIASHHPPERRQRHGHRARIAGERLHRRSVLSSLQAARSALRARAQMRRSTQRRARAEEAGLRTHRLKLKASTKLHHSHLLEAGDIASGNETGHQHALSVFAEASHEGGEMSDHDDQAGVSEDTVNLKFDVRAVSFLWTQICSDASGKTCCSKEPSGPPGQAVALAAAARGVNHRVDVNTDFARCRWLYEEPGCQRWKEGGFEERVARKDGRGGKGALLCGTTTQVKVVFNLEGLTCNCGQSCLTISMKDRVDQDLTAEAKKDLVGNKGFSGNFYSAESGNQKYRWYGAVTDSPLRIGDFAIKAKEGNGEIQNLKYLFIRVGWSIPVVFSVHKYKGTSPPTKQDVCKKVDTAADPLCCSKFRILLPSQKRLLSAAASTAGISEADLAFCGWDYEVTGCFSPKDDAAKAVARTKTGAGKGALICLNEDSPTGTVTAYFNAGSASGITLTLTNFDLDQVPRGLRDKVVEDNQAGGKFTGGFKLLNPADETPYKFYNEPGADTNKLGDFAILDQYRGQPEYLFKSLRVGHNAASSIEEVQSSNSAGVQQQVSSQNTNPNSEDKPKTPSVSSQSPNTAQSSKGAKQEAGGVPGL